LYDMAEQSKAAQGQPQEQSASPSPPSPSSPAAQPPRSTKEPVPPPERAATGEELEDRFDDFDDPKVYKKVKDHGENDQARNFVVRFGAAKAQVALDLNINEFKALLKKDNKKQVETPIRWM